MANPYINLYMANPTAGGTDGTFISTDGSYDSPLTVTLDAAVSETKIIKLAVRTESGYETSSSTTIADVSDTNDRWKLSISSDTGWADSITFTDTITATNTIFYAKATSSTDENPQIDRSVSFRLSTRVSAV